MLYMETLMTSNVFARRLNLLRKRKHLTQKQLALLAGTTDATISRYEKGMAPSHDMIFAVADALEVSPAELFQEQEGPQPRLWIQAHAALDHALPLLPQRGIEALILLFNSLAS